MRQWNQAEIPGEQQQEQAKTLDQKLATSLARVLKGPACYDIVDRETNNIFRVSVEQVRTIGTGGVHVLYIVAGPPGVTCKCCGGAGVQEEREVNPIPDY